MKQTAYLQCARVALTTLLAASLALPAAAQQDANARASREREALRRVQQALKQADEQRSALQRDNAALLRDKTAAVAAAQQAQGQVGGAQADARAERGRVAQLQAELAAQKQTAGRAADAQRQQLQSAQAKADELAAALARSQAALDERSRTLAAVNQLLALSTQAAADAEQKNRRLYALSRELIEQVRSRTRTEPVLGLGQVELENWAEQARDRIEPERITR